jgi:hypothetical protein
MACYLRCKLNRREEMPLYYGETGSGACLREAKNKAQAGRDLLREVGTAAGVTVVRLATKGDIDLVKNMGGYVPEAYREESKHNK